MIEIKSLLEPFNDIKHGAKTVSGKLILEDESEYSNLTSDDIIIQNPDELLTSKIGGSHDVTKALHLKLQDVEFSERLIHKKMCHKCILLSKFENSSAVKYASFIILNYNKKIYLLDPFTYKDSILEFKTFKEALEKRIFDLKTEGSVVSWRIAAPSDFKFKKLIDYFHIY